MGLRGGESCDVGPRAGAAHCGSSRPTWPGARVLAPLLHQLGRRRSRPQLLLAGSGGRPRLPAGPAQLVGPSAGSLRGRRAPAPAAELSRPGEGTSRPVGRILYPGTWPGWRSSICDACCQASGAIDPEARASSPRTPPRVHRSAPFLILLRVGFAEPPRSPGVLVVSYTAVSPLPLSGRYVLCGTVTRVAPGGCYPPPCSVESGPSSAPHGAATARPTRPASSLLGIVRESRSAAVGAIPRSRRPVTPRSPTWHGLGLA